MDKNAIRLEVKERLKKLATEDIAGRSRKICDEIITIIEENNVKSVLSYMPLKTEVDVSTINEYCRNKHIDLYLPRVSGQVIESVRFGELHVGSFNILEPVGQAEEIVPDLVIVPVMAISKELERLGKGKGFYDRYLEGKQSLKLAVAFDEQLYDKLPTESHDALMDIVIVG